MEGNRDRTADAPSVEPGRHRLASGSVALGAATAVLAYAALSSFVLERGGSETGPAPRATREPLAATSSNIEPARRVGQLGLD